jgi:hypothetical protein
MWGIKSSERSATGPNGHLEVLYCRNNIICKLNRAADCRSIELNLCRGNNVICATSGHAF